MANNERFQNINKNKHLESTTGNNVNFHNNNYQLMHIKRQTAMHKEYTRRNEIIIKFTLEIEIKQLAFLNIEINSHLECVHASKVFRTTQMFSLITKQF